jgi:hypothetical protein
VPTAPIKGVGARAGAPAVGGEDPRRLAAFRSTHRPQQGFQPTTVSLDRFVRILLTGLQRQGAI